MMRQWIVYGVLMIGLAACNLSNDSISPANSATEITAVTTETPSAEAVTCPVLIQQAIEDANQQCQGVDRNQACYGNYTLLAQSRSGEALPFEKPGDIVNLSDLKSLSLAAFDQSKPEWGVALMKVQADVPDTLPGQNVAVVLFGNTQLEDQSPDPAHPMQAFYFQSGIGNAPCAGIPGDGILIQTPEGAGEIHLTINEAQISLGSTAFVQAQPNDEMILSVVEGQAQVSAFDKTVIVPAGAQTRTTLNANGAVAAPPADPEPYDASTFQTLPFNMLPEKIRIAEPATLDTFRPSTATLMPSSATFEEKLIRAGWIGEGEQARVGKLTNMQIVFNETSEGNLAGTMMWVVPGERGEQLNSAYIIGNYFLSADALPLKRGAPNPWASIRGVNDADVIAWFLWRNTDNQVGEIQQGSIFAFILKQEGELRGVQYFEGSSLEKPDATFTLFGFNFNDATSSP